MGHRALGRPIVLGDIVGRYSLGRRDSRAIGGLGGCVSVPVGPPNPCVVLGGLSPIPPVSPQSEAFTRTTQTVTRRQRRRQRRWHLVALGLGLLLLFILGLALALALARSSPGTVTSTVPTPQGETKHPPSTARTLLGPSDDTTMESPQ